MIAVIDFGMGNLKSISNMLNKIGAKNIITNKKEEIKNSNKLILPGVGSFDTAIKNIKELDLFDKLNEKVLVDRTPVFGICLGMQLLTLGSEEGVEQGFGWINANTIQFKNISLKVPHMGWNSIELKKRSPLFDPEEKDRRFYFVHSYYVKCNLSKDILATTDYGQSFTSMIEKDNIYGAQFHPEKSHSFGLELLTNFANL